MVAAGEADLRDEVALALGAPANAGYRRAVGAQQRPRGPRASP